MAEIRVEPKRGGLGWLWIVIALIIIALVAWYFLSSRHTTATTTGMAAGQAHVVALLDATRATLAA
ncbi:MAG TPA: hypothetical protein VFS05_13640 [Gemmatimonadaceae bacterium]|nr:hypothetical protein [Gemmatimonadaceae bacterium]